MGQERLRNYIGGEWTDSDASEAYTIRNPATGEALAETPLCGKTEVDAAVGAAKEAFSSWRDAPLGLCIPLQYCGPRSGARYRK